MKKIPYGISDYQKIKEKNCYYIDKTMYLESLEKTGDVIAYFRPGRFGKSLFTSMLYYYYDVNSKDLFKSLFKDTYVYDNPTPNKNNYYILRFDFSNVSSSSNDTEEQLKEKFTTKVADGIRNFNITYKENAESDYKNIDPETLLLNFLSYFRSLNLDKKLYIIIDEYDNFTNAILEGDASRFKNVVGKNGFIRNFYSAIKEYCGLGVVDRVFITGICPLTLDSLTTGFNISINISVDAKFNSMIGLTHEEVKALIKDMDIKEDVFKVMLENYNGYLFNQRNEDRVFNATLVMYFLMKYLEYNQVPDKLLDENIAFNYGKIKDLITYGDNIYYKDILDEILKNNTIIGSLKYIFNLEEDFTKDDIISLLYYFGYLTIYTKNKTIDKTIFQIPNYVTESLYYNYFLKLLNDMGISTDNKITDEFKEEVILEGQINKLNSYVEKIINQMDNRQFIKHDERYIILMYQALLFNNSNYKLFMEYPLNGGYVDLIIFRNSEICKYDIMIEFKYIKKEEFSDKLLEEKKKEAEEQLNKYSQDNRLDKNSLKKYIVIYVGKELKYSREV